MGLTQLLPALGLPCDVPVDPDAPPAREWVIEELAKPQYQAAQPSLFDQLVAKFMDWVNSLQFGSVSGPPALAQAVLVGAVIVVLVVLFLVFGVPRLNRRSAVTGSLFGEDDDRNAAAMRAAATEAAGRGDYTAAIAEMFRAIARGLAERTILTTSPGTTAHDFAVRAGEAFPESRDALGRAAESFDGVRYLGRDGDAAQYEQIAALERTLRTARAVLEPALA